MRSAARFIIDHQRGNRTVKGMMAAATARPHMIHPIEMMGEMYKANLLV